MEVPYNYRNEETAYYYVTRSLPASLIYFTLKKEVFPIKGATNVMNKKNIHIESH